MYYRPIFCLIFRKIWGNFRIFFGKFSEICEIQFSGTLSCVDDQYFPSTSDGRKGSKIEICMGDWSTLYTYLFYFFPHIYNSWVKMCEKNFLAGEVFKTNLSNGTPYRTPINCILQIPEIFPKFSLKMRQKKGLLVLLQPVFLQKQCSHECKYQAERSQNS